MNIGKFFDGFYYGRYDKTVHIFASSFFCLFFLLFFPWIYAILIIFSIGIIKEFYDKFFKKKKFDFFDIAANMVGTMLALCLWYIWNQLK